MSLLSQTKPENKSNTTQGDLQETRAGERLNSQERESN